VTVPVGVPDPGATALTVAVNVTDCPNTALVADELTAVVVLALLTVCVKTAEVLELKLVSPLYAALLAWPPTLNELVLNVAKPEALTLTGASGVPSTVNVMVPVRVPVPGATAVTVAVIVTVCPKTELVADELTVVAVLALLTVCAI